MRGIIAAAAVLVLTGCGGADTESIEASGVVTVIGISKAQVLAADGATTGDRCQGVGTLGAFSGGEEVIVLDADGSKVAVGTLQEGVLPDGVEDLGSLGFTMCEFAFTVPGVPDGEGLLTLRVGEAETTFRAEDARSLDLEVAGDEYPG